MTLIVAVGYQNGIVLGAESAATDPDSHTKQPATKIRRIPNHPVLFAGSGDSGVLQRIEEALAGYTSHGSLKRTRQELKKLVLPELTAAYAGYVHVPGRAPNPPVAITLFAGLSGDTPFILEINENGTDTVYDDDLGAFAAIGSGKVFAQAICRPHLKPASERSRAEAKVLVCRVIEDSISLAAAGLGPPVRMHYVEAGQGVVECTAAEIKATSDTCNLWREIERESLGKALAPAAPTAPAPEIPAAVSEPPPAQA